MKLFDRITGEGFEPSTFGLSRSTPQGFTEVTTGGDVEGPSLHFVLANYRKVVTMPSTRQLLWERPLRPDAGPAYDPVAGTHQTIVRVSGFLPSLLSPAPSQLAIAYQLRLPIFSSLLSSSRTAQNLFQARNRSSRFF
jgi:hypothetical protein